MNAANNRQYQHNNHWVGSANVHLVSIPKGRKKVLVGEIKLRRSQILTEVANEKGWIIKALEIAPYYVHILVEDDSSVAINQIVKAFNVDHLDI